MTSILRYPKVTNDIDTDFNELDKTQPDFEIIKWAEYETVANMTVLGTGGTKGAFLLMWGLFARRLLFMEIYFQI
jgi:hypothetical protein